MEQAKTDVMPTDKSAALAHLPSPLTRWNLDVYAIGSFAKSLTSAEDESLQQDLMLDVHGMATELAGADPSPAVRMLAETAAVCWAELRKAEITFSNTADATIKQADFQQRNIDRCHARLMRSLRTLAQVRRLERDAPAVQVNVMQAVNVGGAVSTR